MELHELLLQRAHKEVAALAEDIKRMSAERDLPDGTGVLTEEEERTFALALHTAGALFTTIAEQFEAKTLPFVLAVALGADGRAGLDAMMRASYGTHIELREIADPTFTRLRELGGEDIEGAYGFTSAVKNIWFEAAAIRATGAPSNAVDA